MLAGAGGNITVQVGENGVLLVDAGFSAMSEEVLAVVRELSAGPIRRIINTHLHFDHIEGNWNLARTGEGLMAGFGAGTRAEIFGDSQASARAQIIAHLNVLNRMVEENLSADLWPESTFDWTLTKTLFFNGEGIEVLHQPRAHTDGDVMVFFRRSDVISTGDVFVKTSYPAIDLERGGSVNGIIDALNRILDLTITVANAEGGTLIIPGHGRISDQADVVDYRDMVTIIRDRIQSMMSEGMTLDQVKAARPTLDYDPLYGSESGPWTAEMFVEAVYRSLSEALSSE